MPAKTDPSLPPFLSIADISPPSQARLQALYASSSAQRLSNPTGYNANISWWADVIQETLRSGWLNGQDGDKLVLKADDDFVGRFDWSGRRPRGLGGVLVRILPAPSSALLNRAGA
jgi:charged multivesicular body protein 7